MGFWNIVTGIGDVLSAPIKVLSDWANEPLKRAENRREQDNKDADVARKIRIETALSNLRQQEETSKLNNQIKAETEKEKIRKEIELNAEKTRQQIEIEKAQKLADISIAQGMAEVEKEKKRKEIEIWAVGRIQQIETDKTKKMSEIAMAEKSHEADLQIRMQTEVNRINVEIEEMQKDRQFERMKMVTEAIAKYKQELTELNINTIRAIGEMELELREKAQNLVLEKTKEFMAIQDAEIENASKRFLEIEEKFAGKPSYEPMLMAVQNKLANVIDITDNFMKQLNEQITTMNENINVLTQGGQVFIRKQLETFNTIQSNRVLVNGNDAQYTIENQ
jgi:acetyl/propionyl-CoA carboxylase alpha subunit